MTTVANIIERWPSAEHFAADVGLKYASYGRVLKLRGRIPERYWDAALSAAGTRGIELSREDLEAAHAPIPEPAGAPA